MTVKLNRWGYLFSGNAMVSYFLWAILYAYCIYCIFTDSNTDAIVLIPLTIMFLIVEIFCIMYFPITSFRVGNGYVEYYGKVEAFHMGQTRSYEKMGFLIKDVKSIEICSSFPEKLFGFAHITVEGLAEGASSFDTHRIPTRNEHYFYGIRNPDELYVDLCKFFPEGIVKNNANCR